MAEAKAARGGTGAAGKHRFLQAMDERVLLADGAMGTMLYARGIPGETCFDGLNLSDKDLVQDVHLRYLRAGAEVIQTNTFGANRFRLGVHGLADKVWDVNLWGVKVARNAREVAGEPAFVAGSVGPTGKYLQPLGPLSPQEVRTAFREQMEGLLAGGVDLFIIETMSDLREVAEAVAAARELCRLPIVVEFSFTAEGETLLGASPEAVAAALAELGELRPDVVGINCGAGPAPVLEALQILGRSLSAPAYLSALPNAGLPIRVEGRYLYQAIPQYVADFVPRFAAAGARLVGGCCGTTPEHTAAMRLALDELQRAGEGPVARSGASGTSGRSQPADQRGMGNSRDAAAPSETVPVPTPTSTVVSLPRRESAGAPAPVGRFAVPPREDALAGKLGRDFVISVELDPPRGAVAKKFLQGAAALRDAGVDVINVGDSPMARVRMSSLAGAQLIMAETRLETIIHFTTRDRNLMGIQADLLGAHALGVRNILALTGDPPALGHYSHATAIYDVDSIGLIQILQGLNQGQDVAGNPIGRPTEFSIACALSPNIPDLDLEIQRFHRKVDAGAHFVMTQPLYEIEPLVRVLDRLGGCPLPILLGVMPLHSSKHAEYLHHEVPGISIPAHTRDALRKAGDAGERVGLEKAREVVSAARDLIQGVYIVPSFGKYEGVCDLIQELRATEGNSSLPANG